MRNSYSKWLERGGGVIGVVEAVGVVEPVAVVEPVGVAGVVWLLRTETSQQEEQEQLYVLLDHAAARLVKMKLT